MGSLILNGSKVRRMQYIGVNISERKSGTERKKKRKKRELVFLPPPGSATGTLVHRLNATRTKSTGKTHQILQTDTWHDQMVILYYEIHSFGIIDVPLPSTGICLPSSLTST